MTLFDRLLGRPAGRVEVFADPPLARVAVARTYNTRQLEQDTASTQAWQHEAWRIWDKLGEIHYPTTQIARLVSRLDWNTEPEFDLVEFFDNPGIAEVTRTIAINLIVAGEGWLTTQVQDESADTVDLFVESEDEWRVYSVVEPNLSSKLEKTGIRIRVWTPDPRNSNAADSGVRAAIPPGNELIALQNLALSQIHSRIASNGILLRPNTRQPLVDENGDPVDFTEMLHESMVAAITDTMSTAALAPIDVEVPADEIEFWTHLTFERPYDERVDERMERVIRRIALALDIWPELLLGVADINHWGSWFLSEDTWRSSTAPLAMQVAQAMEMAVLEKTGREITIEPDPAVLLARRSSVRDALNAAWIGGVGLKYIREVIGAGEQDAPSPEELDIIRVMAGQRRSESRAGLIAGEEEEITPSAGPSGEDAVLGAAAMGDLESGLGVELVRVDDQLSAWLEGSSEVVIDNIRGQVGVRLRRALRADPRSVLLDGVPNSQAAAFIGEATFDLIDADAIVRAGISPLVDRWEDVLARAQSRIAALTNSVGSEGEWFNARTRSVDILDVTLYDHIMAHLTEKTSPFVELRSVVSAAGID
jgi:hypothetical protein